MKDTRKKKKKKKKTAFVHEARKDPLWELSIVAIGVEIATIARVKERSSPRIPH